uniref:OCA domain-containing protein n=1 Tax=Xiphophorus couchianus TaxID=32473 RepID=A0A3B5LAU7_9TELE
MLEWSSVGQSQESLSPSNTTKVSCRSVCVYLSGDLLLHWFKAQPSAQGRSRPYQGVRVRDPVKELLRRKRSLEHHSTKTTHFTAVRTSSHMKLTVTNCNGVPSQSSTAGVLNISDMFLTIPVAPGQSSLAPMELPDSGLAYPLWAQPLTTISAMPNPGVQFASGSAALHGPPLVHMPLPMSLTAMIPQPETQAVDPHPQILDTQQHSGHELDQEPQVHSLKGHDDEEDKNSYSSSMFLPNV